MNTAPKLPKLPPVDGYDKRVEGHYSAETLQAYATQAIAEHIAALAPPSGEGVDDWRELASEAVYVGLCIGVDCAGKLAELQEAGIYKPRCEDGKPSNANARRDADKIADIYRRGLAKLRAADALSPRPPTPQSAPADGELARIGELIRTQDNRITDQPIFIVQQKRVRVSDQDYDHDGIVWVNDDNQEADEAEHARLEAAFPGEGEPDGWRRLAVSYEWEFVTACFTEQGCKDYIARDGHNLKEPRIYAAGSYRNAEWRTVRNYLAGLTTPPPASQERGGDFPVMRSAFVTSESCGPDNEYRLVFRFRSLEALQQAHREWIGAASTPSSAAENQRAARSSASSSPAGSDDAVEGSTPSACPPVDAAEQAKPDVEHCPRCNFTMSGLGYCANCAATVAEQAQAGELPDIGPFRVIKRGHRFDIVSDDFTTDSVLSLSGDFTTSDQEQRYAEWVSGVLNSATVSRFSGGASELPTLEALAARWDKQALECEEHGERLGQPVGNELLRDAAQYRQCAYQLRATVSRLAGGVTVDDALKASDDLADEMEANGCGPCIGSHNPFEDALGRYRAARAALVAALGAK